MVVTYRSSEQEARTLLESLPGRGHLLTQVSVDDSSSLRAAALFVGERYGALDVLVNNAGITRPVPHDDLESLDDALIDEIFRVNVRGALAAVRAMKGLLAASGDGVVINISSVAARTGVGSNVAYCASKAALDSVTRSLARALAPDIRVVSVAPGWVWGEYARRMDADVVEGQRLKTPLGRLAEADDVARAVLAVTTLLRFSTGCVIPVDGGRPLS